MAPVLQTIERNVGALISHKQFMLPAKRRRLVAAERRSVRIGKSAVVNL